MEAMAPAPRATSGALGPALTAASAAAAASEHQLAELGSAAFAHVIEVASPPHPSGLIDASAAASGFLMTSPASVTTVNNSGTTVDVSACGRAACAVDALESAPSFSPTRTPSFSPPNLAAGAEVTPAAATPAAPLFATAPTSAGSDGVGGSGSTSARSNSSSSSADTSTNGDSSCSSSRSSRFHASSVLPATDETPLPCDEWPGEFFIPSRVYCLSVQLISKNVISFFFFSRSSRHWFGSRPARGVRVSLRPRHGPVSVLVVSKSQRREQRQQRRYRRQEAIVRS